MLDLFAERLTNINIHQGIARLDFDRLESVNPEKKEAVMKPAMRVVMPLAAFLEMADQVNKIRESILKQMASSDAAGVRSSSVTSSEQ